MNFTYPGVYVEDRPVRARPVEAAGTSTAAFLGASERGDVLKPKKIFNFQEFETHFGGFLDGYYLAHAVFQFFNNGGTECYVVRTGAGPTRASATLSNAVPAPAIRISARDAGTSTLQVQVTHAGKNRFDLEVRDDPAGLPLEILKGISMRAQDALFIGDQPLSTASLTVFPSQRPAQHDSDPHNEAEFVIDPEAAWTLTVKQDGGPNEQLNIQLAGRSPDDVVRGINAAFQRDQIQALASVIRSDGEVRFRVSGTTIETDKTLEVVVAVAVVTDLGTKLRFVNGQATAAWSAAGEHIGNRDFKIDLTTDLPYAFGVEVDGQGRKRLEVVAGAAGATVKDLVTKAFDDAFGAGVVEVSLHHGDKRLAVKRTEPGEDSYVEVFESDPATPPTLGFDAEPTFGASINRPAEGATPLAGGADYTPNYDDALAALDNIEDVSILVIPGVDDPAVISKATTYCENRKLGCFFIADSPGNAVTLPDAQAWRARLTASAYGAAYFPWVKVPNPHLAVGGSIDVPPSGFVAGIFARTDSRRGVWKAPAGVETTLGGTTGLTARLTDEQHGDLNVGRKAICVLREFAGEGRVVWGARTLAGSGGDRYIPVRRTAIFLKRSIYSGIQWAVFEPNDHSLWAALRGNISAFMNGLFRAEAFQGKRASAAYFVECGLGSTMTQDDIDAGRVIVEVGFAPLKPAEFVVVRIEQMASRPN